MAMLTLLLRAVSIVLPWPLRRWWLGRFFGYEVDASARIGAAWVFPARLQMGPDSRIDHFCIAIHLDEIVLGERSFIGRGNWITGFPSGTDSPHFRHEPDRASRLIVGRHSAITKNHHIDCTSPVEIGDFSTVAGYGSQILTHSIDLRNNRQHSEPISVGDYCFVGTNVTILGGAQLPSFSVLGAKSLLNKPFREEWSLYAGVPATRRAEISRQAAYFSRTTGFVD